MKPFLKLSTTLIAAITSLASTATVANAASSEICPTLYADFYRRQLDHFSDAGVYTIADGEEGLAVAKHIPFLTFDETGTTATIVVGDGDTGGVYHPMVASDDPGLVHFITHLMAIDQDGNIVAMQALDPSVGSIANMTFSVPAGVTELTPYSFCNIHGLWVGDTVSNPGGGSGSSSSGASCNVNQFSSGAWTSVHADFVRRQSDEFASEVPFTEALSEKHVPYITLSDANDGTASIFVGKPLPEGPAHPMDGTYNLTDPSIHWITEIYIVDQSGNIIEMITLDPTNVDTATAEFTIPSSGVESVTAYAWCNIHGLYVSPTVAVSSNGQQAESSAFDSKNSLGAAVSALLAFIGTSMV